MKHTDQMTFIGLSRHTTKVKQHLTPQSSPIKKKTKQEKQLVKSRCQCAEIIMSDKIKKKHSQLITGEVCSG